MWLKEPGWGGPKLLNSGSQLGVILPSGEHLVMSRDTSELSQLGGATGM